MLRSAVGTATLLLIPILGATACQQDPYDWKLDPAQSSRQPSRHRADLYDRHAAAVLELAHGLVVPRPLDADENDATIVALAWESGGIPSSNGRSDLVMGLWPNGTPAGEVMLVRRPRAAYARLAKAMTVSDAAQRGRALRLLDVLESRRVGGVHSDPPYRGPERDEALVAVETLLRDPDPTLRESAAFIAHNLFQQDLRPTTSSVRSALSHETQPSAKAWLLWLYAARNPAPRELLAAATRGIEDPVTVAVAIQDLIREENRTDLEEALRQGDPTGRAGIGETLYRHAAPMPWAQDLIVAGLADPVPDVRARFAKGFLPPAAR